MLGLFGGSQKGGSKRERSETAEDRTMRNLKGKSLGSSQDELRRHRKEQEAAVRGIQGQDG
eukprot:16431080-Heterocapsa_arctica.AAC.1